MALDTKFFPLAWILFFLKPKVEVDGQPGPRLSWGQNMVGLPPGQHHLRVWTPYLIPSRMGPADAVVDVPPGQVVPLEYRVPLWAFSKGSMGPAPQSYNGLGITIGLMVVPFVILLILIIAMIFMSTP